MEWIIIVLLWSTIAGFAGFYLGRFGTLLPTEDDMVSKDDLEGAIHTLWDALEESGFDMEWRTGTRGFENALRAVRHQRTKYNIPMKLAANENWKK